MNTLKATADKTLPDWVAVLDFLASLAVKPTTRRVTITRKEEESGWHVETTETGSENKQPKYFNRGVGLYDLNW